MISPPSSLNTESTQTPNTDPSSSARVSALIRTYNSAQTLEACFESLCAQSLSPEHVVVVDSGSTDSTLGIAQSYGAEIVHYPDSEDFNYSRAINIGMEHVGTPYTLIISSHVSLPDTQTIRRMMNLLRADDNRCAVSIRGMADTADQAETGTVECSVVTESNFVSEYGGIGISNSCNLIPTMLWRRTPFDESIPRSEDQKWLQHYLHKGRTAVRISRPQIVYNNPYYNDTKEVRDIIALAKHDINPLLTEWSTLRGRLRNALSALKQVDLQKFAYNVRIFLGLLAVRLGLDTDKDSRYF